jgi:hypothetical protein
VAGSGDMDRSIGCGEVWKRLESCGEVPKPTRTYAETVFVPQGTGSQPRKLVTGSLLVDCVSWFPGSGDIQKQIQLVLRRAKTEP